MAILIIPSDLRVEGKVIADDITIPSDSVGDDSFDVADPLSTDKQFHRAFVPYGQDNGAVVAAKRRIVHIARAAGVIRSLNITLNTACTGTTSYVKCGLRKNGTTVTSSPAEHNPTKAAYVTGDPAGFSSSTYAAGDKLEVDVTVSAGDGAIGQGLGVTLILDEEPN